MGSYSSFESIFCPDALSKYYWFVSIGIGGSAAVLARTYRL